MYQITKISTVNHIFSGWLFFRDLLEINWFATTNFRDQDVEYMENETPEIFEDWFTAGKIWDNKALANTAGFLARE